MIDIENPLSSSTIECVCDGVRQLCFDLGIVTLQQSTMIKFVLATNKGRIIQRLDPLESLLLKRHRNASL